MSEETMLERVARALWDMKEKATNPPNVSWRNALPEERAFMLKAARAAIEAMREPTPKMAEAGQAVILAAWINNSDLADEQSIADEHDVLAAMIDAALEDPTHGT